MVMSDRIKFEMEFPIKVSQRLLFQYISTPSGLSEWFSDNVNSRGEKFVFIWDDSEEIAYLVSKKPNDKIKFQWEEDQNSDYFFELKIQFDEITKDVSLIVTDFAYDEELEQSKMLWSNQVSDLRKVLGSS